MSRSHLPVLQLCALSRRQFMGLDGPRAAPSRPLRTLSESPAEGTGGQQPGHAHLYQPPPPPALHPSPGLAAAQQSAVQRFMQSPVAKQYREVLDVPSSCGLIR